MDIAPADTSSRLPERLAPVLARFARQGPLCDERSALPPGLVADLHGAGALAAPLPLHLGGQGIGTESHQADAAHDLLRRVGAASLPLGRIYEGHVNALRLILRYGTHEQATSAAADAREGHLFATWIAEDAHEPVRRSGETLHGRKIFASGTGAVTRALVTVQDDGERMALVRRPADGWRTGVGADLHGMRATETAQVDLTGVPAPPAALVGRAGDYMRQPEIALGAWRPLAVLSGGLLSLAEAVRTELRARGRSDHPQQRARFAELLTAAEAARLWSRDAARNAECRASDDAAAYVALARVAIDAACATAIQLAQRSVGLAGFVRPHPVERLCRDLATYMRQPAFDEVIDEAAAHFTTNPLPR